MAHKVTNDELVLHLVDNGVLRTTSIITAFKRVDRRDFVPPEVAHLAYVDGPLPIGHEATISQPTTVAFMLELLQPQPEDHILDVGSGSGYTTALLSSITPTVTGVEIVPALVEQGRRNLAKYSAAQIVQARGVGWPSEAPYDKILVSAAVNDVPAELLAQLVDGGIIVMPVQSSIWKIVKSGMSTSIEKYPGFAFVNFRNV